MMNREVTTDNFNKKPLWVNFINSTWKRSYFLGTKIELEKDHLIKLARKQSGLHSFGEDFWEEPLERLISSINEEADLHPIGRFITQKRLTSLLTIRLRAEHWFRKHPEILEQELYPVYLICGLQRTGTTKLQRLLSADPDNRVLLSWEVLNPVPLSENPDEINQRIAAAKLSEKALKLMAPGFFSIHPVEFEKPEEDILLLDTTFMSTTPEATMNVPSYASWLEQTDQSNAYAYGAKLLKFLQWQRPGKRWILKTPHHMEFLDLVKKHYGKVHYIWTHRDINESLPSFMSMVAHSQTIFSDNVSLHRVAQHWLRKTIYMLSTGIEFRKNNPNQKFTDVYYKDFIAAPMDVIEELYRSIGKISPELHQKFLDAEKINAPNRFGKHRYSLENFNLNKEDVGKQLKFYTDYLKTIQK
ncbi:MAG: sulfotransferase [Bacteroidetes bacterium]|nr:sulfotransferase [Bacteroidota bacterium]